MNAVLGDLPTWNLTDLYSSPAGTDLETDIHRASQEADAFAKDYEGKVAGLDGKTLGAAVARFEALSDLMGRIGSYAQLYYAQDQADPQRGQFSQNMSEKLADIGSKLLFFDLELNRLEDAELEQKLKDPALAKYGPWLRDLRAVPAAPALRRAGEAAAREVGGRPQRLDPPVRRDDRAAALPVAQRGAERAADPEQAVEQDASVRKAAAEVLRQGARREHRAVLADHQHAGQGQGDRRHAGASIRAPASSRNLANMVEDEVVDALVDRGAGGLSRASRTATTR